MGYLLGKDGERENARVLWGNPEEVRELIDASPYAKKYTSGVLSFAEKDLPHGQRERLMESFERVLMPGLDKDQYSVLWVEHQDKGRLELNFVIPNTELLTGKRLQPYFDRADRPRVNAWQTIVNDRLGLHDPNAPENRRTLVTPSNLPLEKQMASQSITDGLLCLCKSGKVKTRPDIIQALTEAGFNVVRTTKSSISLADPDGGRNIRLKGAIYEQSFEAGEGLRAEIERAGERYRADAEARVQRARKVCQRGTELKREENLRRYSRSYGWDERGFTVAPVERAAYGRENMADHHRDHFSVAGDGREHALVPGLAYRVESGNDFTAERYSREAGREDVGRDVYRGPERAISGAAGGDGCGPCLDGRERKSEAERAETGTEAGVTQDDRAGETVAERVRAATKRLLAKAGRVGQSLRGMAENVWAYATGQREAERAGHALESAGGALERATESFEPVVVRHELNIAAERQILAQKQAEQVRDREYPGPTLE